jgi:hypothetical protein
MPLSLGPTQSSTKHQREQFQGLSLEATQNNKKVIKTWRYLHLAITMMLASAIKTVGSKEEPTS